MKNRIRVEGPPQDNLLEPPYLNAGMIVVNDSNEAWMVIHSLGVNAFISLSTGLPGPSKLEGRVLANGERVVIEV